MRRTSAYGRVTAAILVAFTFVHGDCSGFFNSNPGPTINGVTPDDPAITTSSALVPGCSYSSTQNATPYETWKISWSNNTTTHGYILWPKGGATNPATILFWDDPAQQSVTYNAIQQAVRFWQTNLVNASTAAGGYMKLGLQVSGNNSDYGAANVVAEDSTTTYLPQDKGGLIGGDETFLKYSPDFSTLVNARIVLNANLDSNTTYIDALHEVGHALGLDHSRYEWSVMYPYNTSCVNTNSSSLAYGDLQWLLTQYDPRWAPGANLRCIEDGICGGGPRRLSKVAWRAPAASRQPIIPRGARSGPFPSPSLFEQAYLKRPGPVPGHPHAYWSAVEDLDHAETLSVDSQWLASTLVVKAHVVNDNVASIRHGALETRYKALAIDAVVKHLYGPDASIRTGATVVVADTLMAGGEELLDDLALTRSDGQVLVFLRRSGGHLSFDGTTVPIYAFTSAFNSKYRVTADATLAPMSTRATAVNTQFARRTLVSVLNETTGTQAAMHTMQFGSDAWERVAFDQFYRRNGLATLGQRSAYAQALAQDPYGFYRARAARDAREQQRLHPGSLRHREL